MCLRTLRASGSDFLTRLGGGNSDRSETPVNFALLPLGAPLTQNISKLVPSNTHPNTADQTGDIGTDVCGVGGAIGSGIGGTGGKSTLTLTPPHTSDKVDSMDSQMYLTSVLPLTPIPSPPMPHASVRPIPASVLQQTSPPSLKVRYVYWEEATPVFQRLPSGLMDRIYLL